MEDAETLIGGTWQLNVKAHPNAAQQPLSRIPAVANLPMEKTFWTVDKTDIPDVYMNQVGEGRVVYFPWGHRSRLLGGHGSRSRTADPQLHRVGH